MSKKVVFYLKDVPRAVAITDQTDDSPLEQFSDKLQKAWSGIKSFSVTNGRDVLLLKPNEVAAIQVTDTSISGKNLINSQSETEDLMFDDDIDILDEEEEESKEIVEEKSIEISEFLDEDDDTFEDDDEDDEEEEEEPTQTENINEEQLIENQMNNQKFEFNPEETESTTPVVTPQAQVMNQESVEPLNKPKKDINVNEIVEKAKNKKSESGAKILSIEPVNINKEEKGN